MELKERIKTIRAFSSLTDEDAQGLASQAKVVRYESGAKIIRTGEPGDAMYAILSGDAEARVPDRKGEVKFIRRLSAGDVFGEMALLTGEPRSADVIVPDGCTCECMVLNATEIETFLRAHPSIAKFLTDILGERLLASDSLRQLGKYRLMGELGRGAMARVFEGYHGELGRPVAVKMLNHSLVYERDFADRFLREAKLIAEFTHPNIVNIFDFTHAYGTWFIVMERLRGTDLSEVLEKEGKLSPERVRSILEQAASALACAHEASIIHRDVKPGNMFLEPNGTFKLVDFGIALAPDERRERQELACTPEYAAPELVMGQPIDARVDIYALGLSAWTLLAGYDWAKGEGLRDVLIKQVTEDVTPIEQIVPGVPADLARVLKKATAKRPEDRYQNCRELLADLEEQPVGDEKRTQIILSTLFAERQGAEVKRLVAELCDRLNALSGVDSRSAELPFKLN
jgi:serine/threonine protein kinase